MGAGATVAAQVAADAAEDIDTVSTSAVMNAQETLPFGTLMVSYDLLRVEGNELFPGIARYSGISLDNIVGAIKSAVIKRL